MATRILPFLRPGRKCGLAGFCSVEGGGAEERQCGGLKEMMTVSGVWLSFTSMAMENLYETGIQNLRLKILPMASQSGVITNHELTIFPGGRLRLAGGAEVF